MTRLTSAAIVLASVAAGAQAPPAADPGLRFDVASIRQSAPDAVMTRPGSPDPGGRWLALNSTLQMMLGRAYPDYALPGLIVDGPRWITERRFDVDARAVGNPTRDQYLVMVRQLLADRFRLKVHTEPRPVEVYALVVARADRRLGPRLTPASAACIAELEAERARIKSITGPIVMSSSDAQPCKGASGLNPQTGMLRLAGGRTMQSLAFAIQAYTDKRVVDRTDLAGTYEFELEFDWGATRSVALANNAEPGANIFTAVQEQLGLKLDRRTETTEVLVIDSVDMPTKN